MKKREIHYIKVTTTSIYAYEGNSINGWDPDEVIEDWFKSYPMDRHHATRDTHRIGNTTIVRAAAHITEKELDEYIEEMKQHNSLGGQNGKVS